MTKASEYKKGHVREVIILEISVFRGWEHDRGLKFNIFRY